MPGKKGAGKTRAKKGVAPKKAPRKPPAPKNEGVRSSENELRRLLVRKRDEIHKEAREEISKYIKGENRQLVETALDGGDWSVIDLSEDINLRKLGAHHETLVKIDESMRKLNEGTYGVCEDCEEEINSERLKIIPFAIRCRDCQEAKEELEAAGREEGVSYG
jgi:DnaK suppressor protein